MVIRGMRWVARRGYRAGEMLLGYRAGEMLLGYRLLGGMLFGYRLVGGMLLGRQGRPQERHPAAGMGFLPGILAEGKQLFVNYAPLIVLRVELCNHPPKEEYKYHERVCGW